MSRLYLVDVSSLFFRAFYAVRPLTSPSGLPVNAIYGFLSMTLKLLKEERPEYIVFCYDRKEPSFRKDIYAEYKANRAEMPEDLVPQIPYIKKMADLLGIPSMEKEGFEADDIIGALTKKGLEHQMEVFIVSGDKDFSQLIVPHVYLYDTMKNQKLDAKGVVEKWGVSPEKFIDYLGLVGDSSDNVPGVDGIGPKGAQKLLEEFGDLESIYANLDKIKSQSVRDKLAKGKDNAFLSRRLATIVTDIPIPPDIDFYKRKPFVRAPLHEFLHELNFKTFEKTIDELDMTSLSQAGTVTAMSSTSAYRSVETPVASVENSRTAKKEHGISVEACEVKDLAQRIPAGSAVWGLSWSGGILVSDDKTIFQIHGNPEDLGAISDRNEWKWQGYDLKQFWHSLKVQKPLIAWDSLLAAYVVRPGESLALDQICPKYIGATIDGLATPEEIYAGHVQLKSALEEEIKKLSAETIYRSYDLPLAPILYRMEKHGVRIDTDLLREQSVELTKTIHQIEKDVQKISGESFNLASPKQLSHVLFEKLKLPVIKKTKTGFSTDNEVLEKLKDKHPMIELVLQYRELTKLKSTYIDSLPLLVKEDGRVHSSFNQALTATGRLSSIEPNLQNIPIRSEKGARIRRAFVAEPGCALLSVDYSQIELRVLAHFSEDKNLIRAFADDLDIHAATASEVFGVSLKEVTSDMRRTAKAVNFGIAYGQGAFGLAETLGISRTEASEIIKKYFTRFSGVQSYIEQTIASAKDKGYVETLLGRRRYMDELKSKNPAIQKFGERAAINAPIQGTAADIVKKAMIDVDQKVDVPLILQVHDELIFEAQEKKLHKAAPEIVKLMENVYPLRVPLKVNFAIGPNWDEAH